MATIKTAMELALERTASLQADHAGAQAMEAKKAGMKLAAAFFAAAESGEEPQDLSVALEAVPPEQRPAAKEGVLDSLLSALQFPRDEASPSPVALVEKGLSALAGKRGAGTVAGLCGQLTQFFERYLQDLKGLEAELRRQFAPKLKQKEQELRRRTGQDVAIDPMRDPEFVAYYQKSMTQVKGQYQDALDRAKADLRKMIG